MPKYNWSHVKDYHEYKRNETTGNKYNSMELPLNKVQFKRLTQLKSKKTKTRAEFAELVKLTKLKQSNQRKINKKLYKNNRNNRKNYSGYVKDPFKKYKRMSRRVQAQDSGAFVWNHNTHNWDYSSSSDPSTIRNKGLEGIASRIQRNYRIRHTPPTRRYQPSPFYSKYGIDPKALELTPSTRLPGGRRGQHERDLNPYQLQYRGYNFDDV